jgi:periplasmic protein TonB
MKLDEHERARPNSAGLTSPVQQAELKLLLAGKWPPLKPLPVFKYETDEYRASIDFDKTRGEWVCRKTSLPSNKVQELRGGLREITMALPLGHVEVFAECVTAEQQEQELENEANRRLQAILEWRENYGNGKLYSELQDYLSESQQDEIYDSIRMTLTARQLQFNPKNVELVFDAVWNAGGRLATLMEIAQRNKAEQEADAQAQAKAAALEAERQVPVEAIHPTRDRRLQKRTTPASLAYVMFGDTNGGIVVNISETGMAIAVGDLLVVGDYLPRIRIQSPSSRQSIEISAQIVWLAESKKGAGIRFVDLTADARNQISNWIASEKQAPKFEQPPKLLRRDKQHLEISSRKSRRIFSTPSVRDEEAAARYAKMFPSESNDAIHTTPVDETKPQQGPLLIPAATPTDAGVSMFGSAAETSIHDFPQSLEASIPTEPARNFASEPIKSSIHELSEGLTSEPVDSHVTAPLENFPTEPIGSFFSDQVQTSSPRLMARTSPQASEIMAREILDASTLSLVEDLQEKVRLHTPVADFGPQVRRDRVESSADRIEDSPSHFHLLEVSGFQIAAFVLLFVVIGFAVGLTVGRGPIGKRLRDAQKSIPVIDATSPTLLNPDETTSQTSTPPAANTFLPPAVNPPVSATTGSRSESPSAQSLNALPEVSTTNVGPVGPSLAITAQPLADSDNPATSPESEGSTGLIPRNAPPSPAPRRVKPATRAAPHLSSHSTIFFTGSGHGSKPFRLILPEKPIAASSSFAITSQLSVLVSPEPGPAPAHKPALLQAGELVSFVWPRYPKPGERHGSPETVKVRTTIGEFGQVLDVKHVSGSISLLPAAISAIRQWRFEPTLLDRRPVQAQQEITIEFQPPRRLPRVPTRHLSHD